VFAAALNDPIKQNYCDPGAQQWNTTELANSLIFLGCTVVWCCASLCIDADQSLDDAVQEPGGIWDTPSVGR